MFFRRKAKTIYYNTSMFDNNDFANMVLQKINSYPEIISIEIGTGKIIIKSKNTEIEKYWYSNYGYDYMTFEQTATFAHWIHEHMNHSELYECTTYTKCGGGGEFPVDIIVPIGNNPYSPLKKW